MNALKNIGIIGAGKMGTILLNSLKKSSKYTLSYYNPSKKQLDPSFFVYPTLQECIRKNDILFVCTLPSQVKNVLTPYKNDLAHKTIISMAAGISIRDLEECAGLTSKIIRTMPNTPCKIQKGVIAYTSHPSIPKDEQEECHRLLSLMGEAISVDEPLLDPISGLSGSGPAYICIIIEALADGGVRAGIPRDLAYKLACQTLIGTASMVLQTQQHPGELKDEVSSPKGATIEGIFHLEQSGIRYSIMNAVLASCLKCASFTNTTKT